MTVPSASRFTRYMTVILRWLAITLVVFVLTILSGFYITNALPKVYTATAQIMVLQRGLLIVPGSNTNRTDSGFDFTNFQVEFLTMESSDFLLPIIHDLGLDKAWAKRVYKSDQDQDQLSDQDALAYMNKILKLDFQRGTNIINITVSSDEPTEAAAIANAIADRYKTMRDSDEAQRSNRSTDVLRDQIARQQKVVDEAKATVEKMPHDQSTTHLDAQRNLEQQQNLLDALNLRLKQDMADNQLRESPVRIISRAQPPQFPSRPNRNVAYLVTFVAAIFLSIATASFVEIMLLFTRASERTGN
jgi:uncharacterized protein involved in exopolysaccharide biosynthesis